MEKSPVIGIALCGGASRRMGTDKSLINYHGKPQRLLLYDWLKSTCDEAYINCPEKSAALTGIVLPDNARFAGAGPVSGILTAMHAFAASSVLVVACDYPFFRKEDILPLLQPSSILATAYYDSQHQVYEPLLAIYRPAAYEMLLAAFEKGNFSLQQFLRLVSAEKILPAHPRILKNVNDRIGCETAMYEIKNHPHVK